MDYALSGLGCCIVLVGLSPYAIDGWAFSPECSHNPTIVIIKTKAESLVISSVGR